MENAKTMFEKLGYKVVENSNLRLRYAMKSTWNEITFWLIDKSYVLEYTELLTNELLQAINKQVEELGWNNENRRLCKNKKLWYSKNNTNRPNRVSGIH